jgi:nucleotide-binding universal stress UspA family protein
MREPPAGSIVAGFDGSGHGVDALNWAVEAARHRACPLHVVHALSYDPEAPYADPRLGDGPDWLKAKHWLDARAEELTSRGIDATSALIAEAPGDALLAAGRHATMIVVGSRGDGAVPGRLLCSVSLQVSRDAPCPVVVVREPAELRATRVVVGVDGSEPAERALSFALEHAAKAAAPVTVLHAWDDAQAIAAIGIPAPVLADIGDDTEQARETLAAWTAEWLQKYPGVDVSLKSMRVPPVHALVDASRTAALLVVGHRGRNPLAELLLGSVTSSLLHEAACPVAVVH